MEPSDDAMNEEYNNPGNLASTREDQNDQQTLLMARPDHRDLDGTPADISMYNMDELWHCVKDLKYIANSVVFTEMPEELFYPEYIYPDGRSGMITGPNQMKHEFERLLQSYDDGRLRESDISYLKRFRRVRVTFSQPQIAALVKLNLNRSYLFCLNQQEIQVYFVKVPNHESQSNTLNPPALEKQFLLSPPASPPVGWAPITELPPVVNYDLLNAVISMDNDGGSHEIHTGGPDHPSIVVHLSPDEPAPPKNKVRPLGPIQQTRRPPADSSGGSFDGSNGSDATVHSNGNSMSDHGVGENVHDATNSMDQS